MDTNIAVCMALPLLAMLISHVAQRFVGGWLFYVATSLVFVGDHYFWSHFPVLDTVVFWCVSLVPATLRHVLTCYAVKWGSHVYRLFPGMGCPKVSPEMRVVCFAMAFKDALKLKLRRARFIMGQMEALGGAGRDVAMTFIPEAGSKGSYWLHSASDHMPGPEGPKVFLWFFAGAFIAGEPTSYRGMISSLAKRSGMNALLVDYRVAPNRIEHAIDDAVRAYQYLLDQGVPASKIIVGGLSSGGGLSVLLLQRGLRPRGIAFPAGLCLLSPFFDIADASNHAATADVFVTKQVVRFIKLYSHQFVPDGNALYWSPSSSCDPKKMGDFPPIFITTSPHEVCCSAIESFISKAREAEVAVQVYSQPHLFHAYAITMNVTPEGQRCGDSVIAFLQSFA